MHPSKRHASAQPGRRVERPGRTRRGFGVSVTAHLVRRSACVDER